VVYKFLQIFSSSVRCFPQKDSCQDVSPYFALSELHMGRPALRIQRTLISLKLAEYSFLFQALITGVSPVLLKLPSKRLGNCWIVDRQ
jgi:hypothetical protein